MLFCSGTTVMDAILAVFRVPNTRRRSATMWCYSITTGELAAVSHAKNHTMLDSLSLMCESQRGANLVERWGPKICRKRGLPVLASLLYCQPAHRTTTPEQNAMLDCLCIIVGISYQTKPADYKIKVALYTSYSGSISVPKSSSSKNWLPLNFSGRYSWETFPSL